MNINKLIKFNVFFIEEKFEKVKSFYSINWWKLSICFLRNRVNCFVLIFSFCEIRL